MCVCVCVYIYIYINNKRYQRDHIRAQAKQFKFARAVVCHALVLTRKIFSVKRYGGKIVDINKGIFLVISNTLAIVTVIVMSNTLFKIVAIVLVIVTFIVIANSLVMVMIEDLVIVIVDTLVIVNTLVMVYIISKTLVIVLVRLIEFDKSFSINNNPFLLFASDKPLTPI